MKPLTPMMRLALEDAARRVEGLRRTFVDTLARPTWPHHPSTLAALVRHDLLEQRELRNRKGYRIQAWFVTDAGRTALQPVLIVKRDVPLYLAHSGAIRYRLLPSGRWAVDDTGASSGDYTTDPSRSIDHDVLPGPKPKRAAVEVLVGPADVAQFAVHARRREQKRRREAGKALDATATAERLELARRVARERRIDVSREERLVRYMVAQGREQHALRHLVLIEIKLGQRAA